MPLAHARPSGGRGAGRVIVTKQTQSISADAIAFAAIKAWDIPVTGKDVRGLARGDSGPSALGAKSRFAERNADGTNRVHQYNPTEAGLIIRALAARKARRVPTVTAAPLLRAFGLAVTDPAKRGANATKAATKTTPTVNRALGQRAVRVKPAATTPPVETTEA